MIFKSFLFLVLGALASVSHADLVPQGGLTVKRLLTTSGSFGGCMAHLNNYNNPPSCGRNWVTFDCEGIFNDKEFSRRALETAQMAFALDKELYVVVDTTQTINRYCTVKRIDIVND